MKKLILSLLLLPLLGLAQPLTPPPAAEVFHFTISDIKQDAIRVLWDINPGFYLYRDRFKFKILSPTTAQLGAITFPSGIEKTDSILGKHEVYENQVAFSVPIKNANSSDTQLQVTYQGCAEDGYCYAPVTKNLTINFAKGNVQYNNENPNTTPPNEALQLLTSHHLVFTLLGFLGIGLLLSFTPCVLPMIPILSGIIMGQRKHMTTGKAFRLSLTYVLSMSVTYAIAGSLVGYVGGSVQTLFQQPWIIILFSLIFTLMALSMFGLFNITLPRVLEEKLAGMQHHQHAGKYIGVAIMGCLATLIVSPCVTPALVGVLTYISQTGDALIGALSLFAIGVGMGIPLLIIGTGGGKLLPKAGYWMNAVKSIIGVLMLGVAIWMLARVIPGPAALVLWGVLLIISAIYIGALAKPDTHWQKLWKGVGLAMLVYGTAMLVGAAAGNNNPLQPLTSSELHFNTSTNNTISETQSSNQFTRIKTIEDFNAQLLIAKKAHKPVMLDFYADWCVSCKQMEYYTFADTKVKTEMDKFVTLQVDVTKNNAEDKSIMQHFNVIAPPTLLFFTADGLELTPMRTVGEIGPTELSGKLLQITHP